MKSLTHVVLPIALVVGAIFGITFITSYTSPPKQEDPGPRAPGTSTEPPLRFFTLEARPGAPFDLGKGLNPSGDSEAGARPTGLGEIANLYRRAIYQADIEIGETGHHDFWFRNSHPQDVRVALQGKSCQCAGAKLGIVPPAAWQQYLERTAALGGLPLLPSSAPLLAAAGAELQPKITWQDLVEERVPDDQRPVIAAADDRTGPQLGIVRVTWEGKAEGPKTITAEVYAHLPNAPGSIDRLDVQTNIVPSVRLWPPGGAELQFGELLAYTSSVREFILWSSTRRALDLALSLGKSENEPCLVWTEPQPLSDAELTELSRELSRQANFALRARCAYKVRVTLHERRELEHDGMKEVRQMDVGPMAKSLTISAGAKNEIKIALRATIRGEVRIIGGAEDHDRIDLGRPFQSNQEKVKEVRIVSDRPDLDLELAPNATTPPYLEATLTPRMADGRREWTLRVRVPPEKLFGALPSDSAIMLQVKDASKRRIRIPVVGRTFDPGSPF